MIDQTEHTDCHAIEHAGYSARYRRFLRVPRHMEELLAAHYSPDKRASTAVRARHEREIAGMPSGHSCTCVCYREDVSRGWPACPECRRIRANDKQLEPIEQGRSSSVEASMPDVAMLDHFAGLL